MGNIKSFCCRDNVSELDDREERARILSDNNGSTNSLYNGSSNPSQDDLSYGSMNNGEGGVAGRSGSKTQEQSALDKIYQKLAANVIDVAPGEAMVIQPAEFMERQKAYQARLNQIKTAPPLRSSANKVPRNLNNSLLDTSSGNTSRLNASISTAGANSTALNNQLNTTAATISTSNISASHSHIAGGSTSNLTNNTTASNNTSVGLANGSPQHLGTKVDKPRVEYEPISAEEIQLINKISEITVRAIKNLKVVSNEPVVTCFQP